ncbi:hypothetical protein POF45_10390 [Pseudomonas sp. 681]|uniref:DUF1453 domain-containing protein n=1 Tax=Pseudomonas fungipugnans TaxID=3024217 RepID=A0ABT6QLS7_9PSED|nr:DUF6622 family protein [Pseudomonas sp. 681]MDI2591835.1 hypothetical protein [Pseudomonas sp. 681]
MLNSLQHTPLWVYGIFVLLCYYGIKALSPSHVGKTSMLIMPPILLGWSLYSLNLTVNPQLSAGCWAVALLLGCLTALVIYPRKGMALDAQQSGLIVPGTAKTLVLYLLFFAVNYYFGYQGSVHPQLNGTLQIVLLKASASGFVCGLFCGRSVKYYRVLSALRTRHPQMTTG